MIKIVLVAFLSLYVISSLRYRYYNNPYKLYMIFGKKGSGKSTFLVKLAKQYQKKKYAVYTNMSDCMLPGIRIIDPENLGTFVPEEHSVVLLDEVGMLYDNRNFKNFRNEVRDFFKLQRHYKCVVYLASQSFDVDKKLRDLTDKMYLVQSFNNWLSLVRPISKKICLTEASSQGESRISDNLKFQWIFAWRFIKIPSYVKYFESFKAPALPYIDYEER